MERERYRRNVSPGGRETRGSTGWSTSDHVRRKKEFLRENGDQAGKTMKRALFLCKGLCFSVQGGGLLGKES